MYILSGSHPIHWNLKMKKNLLPVPLASRGIESANRVATQSNTASYVLIWKQGLKLESKSLTHSRRSSNFSLVSAKTDSILAGTFCCRKKYCLWLKSAVTTVKFWISDLMKNGIHNLFKDQSREEGKANILSSLAFSCWDVLLINQLSQ